MNKIRFDNTEQILIVESNKRINIDDVLEFVEKIKNNDTLPRRLSILEDVRNVDITFNFKDISKIIEKIKEAIPKYEKVYNAVVLNKPIITACVILVGQEVGREKCQCEVFSTEEAAKKWLRMCNHN